MASASLMESLSNEFASAAEQVGKASEFGAEMVVFVEDLLDLAEELRPASLGGGGCCRCGHEDVGALPGGLFGQLTAIKTEITEDPSEVLGA